MRELTQRAKILLIVGLVILALCIIGAIVQWSIYSEFADSAPRHASGGGDVLGSLASWNKSSQARADQAMNMFIFMLVGCGIGVACIVLALRPPKPQKHTAPVRFAEDIDMSNEPLLVDVQKPRHSRYGTDKIETHEYFSDDQDDS